MSLSGHLPDIPLACDMHWHYDLDVPLPQRCGAYQVEGERIGLSYHADHDGCGWPMSPRPNLRCGRAHSDPPMSDRATRRERLAHGTSPRLQVSGQGSPRQETSVLRSASAKMRTRFSGLKNLSLGSVPNRAPRNVSISSWLAPRSAARMRSSSSVGGSNEA